MIQLQGSKNQVKICFCFYFSYYKFFWSIISFKWRDGFSLRGKWSKMTLRKLIRGSKFMSIKSIARWSNNSIIRENRILRMLILKWISFLSLFAFFKKSICFLFSHLIFWKTFRWSQFRSNIIEFMNQLNLRHLLNFFSLNFLRRGRIMNWRWFFLRIIHWKYDILIFFENITFYLLFFQINFFNFLSLLFSFQFTLIHKLSFIFFNSILRGIFFASCFR